MTISSAPTNGAGVGEAFVQSSGTTAFVQTLAVAPSSGDVLFALASASPTTQGLSALTETNVSWSVLDRLVGGIDGVDILMGIASASASTTINGTTLLPGTSGNLRGNTSFWTGNPSQVHIAAQGTSGTGTALLTASVTPANGVDVLILAYNRAHGAGLSAPSGGFTALTSGSTGYGFAFRRVVGDGSTSYQCGWTSGSGQWLTGIIVMQVPGSASLSAATGVFTKTGIAAGLSKTTVGGRVLTADVGAFTQGPPPTGPSFLLTGVPIGLTYSGSVSSGTPSSHRARIRRVLATSSP